MCRPAAQPVIVGIETAGRLSANPFNFGAGHTRIDCASHTACHLILQVKNVLKCSIVSVCPQMRTRSSVDQLASYSDAITGLADASFQYVPDTQISGHLLDVN